jgi:hypothetical protein
LDRANLSSLEPQERKDLPAYEGGQAQRQREHRDTKGNGLLGNTAKAFSKLGAESYRSNVTAEGTSLSI